MKQFRTPYFIQRKPYENDTGVNESYGSICVPIKIGPKQSTSEVY